MAREFAAQFSAQCTCGQVLLRGDGMPLVAAVCYCRDCQEGSRQIEALPRAAPVLEADGGTSYLIFRKDRIACTQGSELLKKYKIRADSITNRVVASCCNTAMFMDFDKGPHWVSGYRNRFGRDLPPVEFRVFTKSRSSDAPYPDWAPTFPGFPLRLVPRLLLSRMAMMVGSGRT